VDLSRAQFWVHSFIRATVMASFTVLLYVVFIFAAYAASDCTVCRTVHARYVQDCKKFCARTAESDFWKVESCVKSVSETYSFAQCESDLSGVEVPESESWFRSQQKKVDFGLSTTIADLYSFTFVDSVVTCRPGTQAVLRNPVDLPNSVPMPRSGNVEILFRPHIGSVDPNLCYYSLNPPMPSDYYGNCYYPVEEGMCVLWAYEGNKCRMIGFGSMYNGFATAEHVLAQANGMTCRNLSGSIFGSSLPTRPRIERDLVGCTDCWDGFETCDIVWYASGVRMVTTVRRNGAKLVSGYIPVALVSGSPPSNGASGAPCVSNGKVVGVFSGKSYFYGYVVSA